MNEVRAIVEGFDVATGRGERCALATVVSVDGSSYRRPGARMLVCEGGSTIGTISAGCLESDVAEHASGVIRAGTPRLVVYDTSSASDEITWGLGLGCNGIVRVLVEPLSSTSLYVDALKRSLEVRAHSARVVVATVYECHASPETAVSQIELGSRLVIEEGVNIRYERLNEHSASILQREVEAALSGGMTSGARMHAECGSRLSTFFETLMPPVRLVIFGAGHDALPVVAAARELGWHIEVVDPQARPVTLNRFGAADRVTLARPEEVGALGEITPGTMTLVMSHNYTHDLEYLRFALASPAGYIGVMGPRKRTEQMLRDLVVNEADLASGEAGITRIHSPAGLDIGANGPAEIAMSIVAEMRAVLAGRRGGMLRERGTPLHVCSNGGKRLTATSDDARPVAAA